LTAVPVLFTCAGMRVDIVDAFSRAGAFTVAVDLNPLAPALRRADRRAVVPPVADPEYVPVLADLVAEYDARLVVSLADLDQTVLAERRGELGAPLLLPELEVVERARDKYLTHLFVVDHGFDSPPTWLPEEVPAEIEFPVLVKPREGFGARNMFLARDRAELDFFLAYTSVAPMVQRACTGEEFSIDVFCDFEARCLNAIPRTMIESKGGESIKGMTIADPDLIELGRRVAETMRVVGPATVQCFRTEDGRHELTDVNLRFGGAFPLPVAAGSSYPELALALADGERPEPRVGVFREGVVMTRFLSHYCMMAGTDGSLEALTEDAREPVISED
jgi:carbamoyl-phosphate synthase large subunit